jgi:hypothetical protein
MPSPSRSLVEGPVGTPVPMATRPFSRSGSGSVLHYMPIELTLPDPAKAATPLPYGTCGPPIGIPIGTDRAMPQ